MFSDHDNGKDHLLAFPIELVLPSYDGQNNITLVIAEQISGEGASKTSATSPPGFRPPAMRPVALW